MLMAFSIENLLKGILIVEGHEAIEGDKLSKRLSNHSLRPYAEDVSGVTITEPEKCLLDGASVFKTPQIIDFAE